MRLVENFIWNVCRFPSSPLLLPRYASLEGAKAQSRQTGGTEGILNDDWTLARVGEFQSQKRFYWRIVPAFILSLP